jgi:(S)-3,5-dihydroxyphenylglycine transaminase
MLKKTDMVKNSISVNPLLKNIGEDVMGFLNEIQLLYPNAISLASGRPDEKYFDLEDFKIYFDMYVEAICQLQKKDREAVINNLGQYNKTKGIINNLVSKYLEKDEEIKANPEDILITVGTQEALSIAVMTLCDKENDVIIIEDPTYIGITHFSLISGYNIDSAPVTPDGISLEVIEEKILNYKLKNKVIKIVYVIPDFQNPTGVSMSLENRYKLLELAQKHNFLIFEDNAYGEFVYEGERPLSLKALDKNNRVIYIRSFSKTLYPSLRLAAMVANQTILWEEKEVALSDLMAVVKGYITVNTPSINQAVLGGILIKNDFSLTKTNEKKIANMKNKRDAVALSIKKYLPTDASWTKNITYNIPKGGFFLIIKVPFIVNKDELLFCVQKYNVIFTPMSFFYLGEGGDNEIRIAFSNLDVKEIEPAIERLSLYFKDRIN